MSDIPSGKWITSREIIKEAKISRATLNNYIKMEIIPKPLVQKPIGDMKGTKRIGYFPYEVLERIRLVKGLKQEGNPMEDIVNLLKDIPINGYQDNNRSSGDDASERGFRVRDNDAPMEGKTLRLSIEEVQFPAYLMNYSFQIEWTNNQAEQNIFMQAVSLIKEKASRNIFKLFFHWELHNLVRNWRDLVAFHMSFAKMKYTRGWMENLYHGISKSEIGMLQETYEKVKPSPKQTIRDTTINLLMEDGTTVTYQVFSVFFREGIFFLYAHHG